MDAEYYLCAVMVPIKNKAAVEKVFADGDFGDKAVFAADMLRKGSMQNGAEARVVGEGLGLAFHRAVLDKRV